jgi:transcriptional regulator with PAS, ATPase and Fis domain
MKKGNFRDDLFYRISVVPIHIPALRERKDDIPLLIDNIFEKASYEGQHSDGISKDALAIMVDYSWPGNVRELQSAIWYALIKSKGRLIRPAHLPLELRSKKVEKLSRGPSRKLNKENVENALIESGGNKAKAARILGVGRATLYRFLKDMEKQ